MQPETRTVNDLNKETTVKMRMKALTLSLALVAVLGLAGMASAYGPVMGGGPGVYPMYSGCMIGGPGMYNPAYGQPTGYWGWGCGWGW